MFISPLKKSVALVCSIIVRVPVFPTFTRRVFVRVSKWEMRASANSPVAQESMGPIQDRTKEYLSSSDIAVVRLRRLMLQSVKNFKEGGKAPLGLATSIPYSELRGEEKVIPVGTAWQS